MKPHLVGGACTRPLRSQFLNRLIAAGTWVKRETLVDGSSSIPAVIEDALADLVVEGKAEYRADMGYRLAGSAQARRAAQLLRQSKTKRAVFGEPVGNEYRVGVAELVQREGLALVMYDMTLPMPEPGPDSLPQQQRMTDALLEFTTKGNEDGSTGF